LLSVTALKRLINALEFVRTKASEPRRLFETWHLLHIRANRIQVNIITIIIHRQQTLQPTK